MTNASRAPVELLQTLSLEANKASDAKAAARAVVRVGRELLGSVSCGLWLLDSEIALDLLASEGIPDAYAAYWQRIPLGDDVPVAQAVRRGEPLWVGTERRFRDISPRTAQRSLDADRPMAFAALPLEFEQRILGVVSFAFDAPHEFTDDAKILALAVAGQAAQALERARLQGAQMRALAGLRVIAKVGEMVTAASLDVDATLTALSRAVVPDVADWCTVDLIEDGNVRRLTAFHADPAKIDLVQTYTERYPMDRDPSIARILATREAIWVRRINSAMLEAAITDREQLETLLSLGLHSTVQVPLVSEGEVRGVVSFVMAESRREYDETDRDLLVEVGRRASTALTNASIYAREQRARERVSRLAAVTAELARASTTAEVGEVACREGATALGASWGVLYTLEPDKLRFVAQYNCVEEMMATYGEVPLTADMPLTRVVHEKSPVIVESLEQLKRDFPNLAASVTEHSAPYAFMFKPLADRHEAIVGVLAFGFVGPRSFAVDDRAFARTLAEHCAQAFERARILDLERSARDRLALLAAAGDALSATVDYEATLTAVARTALPILGDFVFFDIVETEGEVRRISAAHGDPEVAAMLAASRWQRSERRDVNLCALSSGESARHAHIDEAFLRRMAVNDDHLAFLRALQLCSLVTVPVILRGAVIGALTFCYGRSRRHHSPDDLETALELARRAAVAVDQARLYGAATSAARRAEEANQLKDDFLATVSHELRTPLNAILGWAHLLDGERLNDRAYLTRGLDVIRRNSHAQREIIEDILDVSRIISGKIRLEILPIDIALVVKFAVEAVRPAAEAKAIQLRTIGLDDAAPFVGDRGRLQQVVWNLLVNAVKFTSRNGTVTVELVSRDDTITVRVTDDGIGIDAEILPYVFDRFRQADSSTTRMHGGLGLGLSIVRHLVELHGGAVAAHSEGQGKGAVFEVALPAMTVSMERQTGSHAPAALGASGRPSPSLDGVHALVVDDAPDSLEVVAALLQKAGATVRVAMNANEAVHLYEREAFDVVVSDIAMPDVDGYALLGMLQRKSTDLSRRLCAIALTAHSRPEDRTNAMQAGFAAHVAKPIDPPEVLATIARVLEAPATAASPLS